MQNPYVKYLKTKMATFIFFIMNTAIFSVAAFPMTAGQCRRKLRRKPLLFFSVCQYEAIIYLLYSGGEGQLYLASSADFANWEHRPLRNGTSPTDRTRFFLLPSKEAFHIIYHLPTEATGVDSLVYSVFRNGQWKNPIRLTASCR